MINGLDIEQGIVFKALAELGGQVEEELGLLLECFLVETNKADKLKKVAEYASNIKARSRDIESECLKVLLRHHPVARDLRVISAATKISTDLERIGDNGGDISEIIPFVADSSFFTELGLIKMGEDVKKMVSGAVDAFVSGDIEKAKSIIISDDIVDNAFISAKAKISEIIKKGEKNADEAPDLLMIAKYFERMGDHAVSLARYVGWSVEGKDDWLLDNGGLK